METVHAVFEGGMFRPEGEVLLPEGTRVAFEPRLDGAEGSAPQVNLSPEGMDSIHALLSERYNSGVHDAAEQHDGPATPTGPSATGMAELHAILRDASPSGHHDTAERHNELQP